MQRINLFTTDLLPQREWLEFRRVIWLLPMVIVLLLLLAYGQRMALQQERASTQKARDDMQSVLNQIADMSRQLPQTTVIVDAATLRQQLHERQTFLASLQSESAVQKGFSPFLLQLAQQSDPAIWLTDIQIDPTAVQLKGATLKPENMPDWLLTLQQPKTPSALRFGQLQLQRVDDKPILQFTVHGQWQ